MKGLTQSYFMYDSVTYQKANAMIKQLESEADKKVTQKLLTQSVESMLPKSEDIETVPVKPKPNTAMVPGKEDEVNVDEEVKADEVEIPNKDTQGKDEEDKVEEDKVEEENEVIEGNVDQVII